MRRRACGAPSGARREARAGERARVCCGAALRGTRAVSRLRGNRSAVRTGLVLAGWLVSGVAAVAGPAGPGDTGETVTVAAYCEGFAGAYAYRTAAARAVEGSLRVERSPVLARWLSNLFHPPGSRFVAGYRCAFEVAAGNAPRRVSVGLYLAETRAFAEYTQWEVVQIVPIARVVDPRNGRAGYGVFKYLRAD